MAPPHDLEAEESVLGSMLLSDAAISAVSESLVASDFYKPAHAIVYDAMLKLHANGVRADAVSVRNALVADGSIESIGNPAMLVAYQANVPSPASVLHYAEIVISYALRRRLVGEGLELVARASDLSLDVNDVLEGHQVNVTTMGSTIINHEPDDISVEEFMERPKDEMSPWVIHKIIRRKHKVILVGGEGSGKSWLLRYMAICAAYGVHPFRHTLERPVRTLIVDLENPEDALYDSFSKMLEKVSTFNPQMETTNRLWWRPAGMNLRNRVDLAEFENVIRARRPDLVCFGPLYAAYENSSKDFGWETAAREVQTVLKKLMVRYNFALLIEDHAPQADGAGKRQMRPYGSSFWRRWPDIGIGMEPIGESDEEFKLSRWRGDRVPTDWPEFIARGSIINSPWPFCARWPNDSQYT